MKTQDLNALAEIRSELENSAAFCNLEADGIVALCEEALERVRDMDLANDCADIETANAYRSIREWLNGQMALANEAMERGSW